MNAARAQSYAPTRGYSQIPNALIENSALLTHAELVLSLVVIRRGGDNVHVTIPDKTVWEKWTGLSARSKEYAASGLKKKGLEIEGKGEDAQFAFDFRSWNQHAREHEPVLTPDGRYVRGEAHRPRTEGRAVSPKPGAKVHPECAEQGCAMLRAPEKLKSAAAGLSNGLSVLSPTPAPKVKPPAQPVAQPVAQTDLPTEEQSAAAESAWAKSLKTLRGVFPWIDVVFLWLLLAKCKLAVSQFSDEDLAQAVDEAWKAKKHFQSAEGLFLMTVPPRLAVIRKRPPPPPPPLDVGETARSYLHARVEELSQKGGVFREYAVMVQLVANSISPMGFEEERVEEELYAIQERVSKSAIAALSADQRLGIIARVADELKPYAGKMSPTQLAGLEQKAWQREALENTGLRPLSLFYARL